jgi:hypothetical protein
MNEPCFSGYWHIRQEEAMAYVTQFGLPHILLTFTLGQWIEANKTLQELKDMFPDIKTWAQLRYCPVETITFLNSHGIRPQIYGK